MIETLKRAVDAMNPLTTIYAEEPTGASGSHFERGLSFSKAQVRDMQAAITNLRTLITRLEKQEPVAWGVFHEDGSAHIVQQKETADVFGRAIPLYTHPSPAVAQEPVYWVHPMDIGRYESVSLERLSDEQIPLYTHPAPAAIRKLQIG
jgi:hypothetical protein